jgi:serine/threonine protein kinase
MKPEEKDQDAATPAGSEAPSGEPSTNRTFKWMVPGGETLRALGGGPAEATPPAPAAPSPAPVAPSGRLPPPPPPPRQESTLILPDLSADGPVIFGSMAVPEANPDHYSVSGTMVLPDAPRSQGTPVGGTMVLPSGGPPPRHLDGDGDSDGVVSEAAAAAVTGGTMVLPDAGPPAAGRARPAPPTRPRVSPTPTLDPAAGRGGPGLGSRIGQYEIIRELGSGGMGTVYLARDDRLGRRVAIKVLQTGTPELTRRFIVEARATAQCSHENIVIIYEVGELQGSPFMVLEYLQGQTLATVMKKSAPLPPSRAVELIVSVVRALDCAHQQGIVHRDLKPENILLTDSGTVKVLDFGIAKVLKDERDGGASEGGAPAAAGAFQDAQRSGIVGTMSYMSPEQWGVGGEIDNRTDIWATGIILYTMLSGYHPYETLGDNPYASVAQLDVPLPRLRDAAPEIPRELADVVDRCLRKRKEERLPDAAALLRALEPFMPGRFAAGQPVQIESGPYAGLRSFQEEDAGRFFGRSREIAAMVTRIQDFPLMGAVGPSGVGKSSFVRAGVVPALKASGEKWESLVVRPGRDPVLALAALLSPMVGSSTTVQDDIGAQKELAARLRTEPGYFGTALRASARRDKQKLLLFVDQFEELYTLTVDAAARRTFTACLTGAADDPTSPVRVIVSMRSDFLDRIAEDPDFMNELAKGLFFLGPPGRDGLREAIVHPAELAGYRFETPRMVDEMLGHLESTPGALPLLQFTAAQLWETRDPQRKLLTEQSYNALGGISGALVSHADRVMGKLTAEARAMARTLFVHLVTAERTRAVRDLDELREIATDRAEMDRLVNHMVESRLLVVQTGGGGAATVEIVHESLIESWPMLRRWLDESHEDSVFLDQLRAAARQWQGKKRDTGLLWRGEAVDELARFKRRYRGELPEVQKAFMEAVFTQQARGARLRRRLLAGAGVVTVGLLAAAGVALFVIHNAQTEAEQNAVAARQAQGDAQHRLQEVEAKERERQKAEALQQVAQKEAASANTKVAMTNEELAEKNIELKDALDRARDQKEAAEDAQGKAEESAKDARTAEDKAKQLADRLEVSLKKEKERADRLNAQLGALVEALR